MKKSRVYALIDKNTISQPVLLTAAKLAGSGVDIIQLRDKISPKRDILKQAILLSRLLRKTATLFIVNDHADIARLSESDGLHIGQLDLPIQEARRIIGKNKIIGVSCSNLKQALSAKKEGADYIAIGPIFKTKTKPHALPIGLKEIKDLSKKVNLPVFAIGNINKGNLDKVISCGIKRIAVCRAILGTKNISRSAKFLSRKLKD